MMHQTVQSFKDAFPEAPIPNRCGCGEEPRLAFQKTTSPDRYRVECTCGKHTPWKRSEIRAILNWNYQKDSRTDSQKD